MNNMWKYTTVEELFSGKFLMNCYIKTLEGWELIEVVSLHRSGFTIHKGTFKKYEQRTQD